MTKQELINKYPKIFSLGPDSKVPAGMFGIECNIGWLGIIDCMCSILQFDTDNNNSPQIVCTQCKEKYGGLRFYTGGANDAQEGVIKAFELLSYRVCELCGKLHDENISKDNGRGWVVTLCPECFNKIYNVVN